MRLLYTLAWYVALPIVLARLWWRGRKEPGYRQHIAERMGWYANKPSQNSTSPIIWLHAVSVGETRAAQPLIEALLSAYPGHTILLTHMTPTGRATGATLFGQNDRVTQAYVPYDIVYLMSRFLKHFKPTLCLLMETEVWPNLIAQCIKHRVPVALVNARLSERSLRKAQRFSALMTEAARGMSIVAAQTDADARRLRSIGATNVHVTGSIKFDVAPPEMMLIKGRELRVQLGSRPILLCASTREGEEAQILEAMNSMPLDDVLVIIVPRHPQRFDEVAQMLVNQKIAMMRRSELGAQSLSGDIRVLLGDSMGEMFAYYEACDVAFIGGSLAPLGGQNLIEACALGKPVLIGPHTFNFYTVTLDAIASGAALRVTDSHAMLQQAVCLFENMEQRLAMGREAKKFAEQHRGATIRTLALLKSLIHTNLR